MNEFFVCTWCSFGESFKPKVERSLVNRCLIKRVLELSAKLLHARIALNVAHLRLLRFITLQISHIYHNHAANFLDLSPLSHSSKP